MYILKSYDKEIEKSIITKGNDSKNNKNLKSPYINTSLVKSLLSHGAECDMGIIFETYFASL